MTESAPIPQSLIESEQKSVVIVTALDVETKAVLRHLSSWSDDEVDNGTVFYTGVFQDWHVAVVEVGPGNVAAAALGTRAIGRFRAGIALFVGVGGGVKDVQLGDVVVASKVYGYEGGKDTATGFSPRPDLQHSAHALEQRARAMCKRNQWRQRLDRSINCETEPNLFVGPVAAGEKVVAATRSNTARFLKKHYGDTLAVEMEGRGFLEAVHIHQVLGTVIRGISDRLTGKSAADKAGWQRKAADAASAVAFELLSSLGPKQSTTDASIPEKAVAPSIPGIGLKGAMTEAAGPGPAFVETPWTMNEGSFFDRDEILARVGVKDVDEIQFLFERLPDSYLRIIRKSSLPEPLPFAHLKAAADFAPLLKHRQYGCFSYTNKYGAVAYEPSRPNRGGPSPLCWATQLFRNGELWLASNTMIVRDRGRRPEWVPIPFIPAVLFEQIFYDKAHAAVEFAALHLALAFPCEIEMGLLGTAGVTLALNREDMREIRTKKVICRRPLSEPSNEETNRAVLAFFEQVYDATGYARPKELFNFPPGPPHP